MFSLGSPGDADSALLNGVTELQCAQELPGLGAKSVAPACCRLQYLPTFRAQWTVWALSILSCKALSRFLRASERFSSALTQN